MDYHIEPLRHLDDGLNTRRLLPPGGLVARDMVTMKQKLQNLFLQVLAFLCVRTACRWLREHPYADLSMRGYIVYPNRWRGQTYPSYVQYYYSKDLRAYYDVINIRKTAIWYWLKRHGIKFKRDHGHVFTLYVARKAAQIVYSPREYKKVRASLH